MAVALLMGFGVGRVEANGTRSTICWFHIKHLQMFVRKILPICDGVACMDIHIEPATGGVTLLVISIS
jgi:ribosomal protein S9